MDGEYNGKNPCKMDDIWGENPLFLEKTPIWITKPL